MSFVNKSLNSYQHFGRFVGDLSIWSSENMGKSCQKGALAYPEYSTVLVPGNSPLPLSPWRPHQSPEVDVTFAVSHQNAVVQVVKSAPDDHVGCRL